MEKTLLGTVLMQLTQIRNINDKDNKTLQQYIHEIVKRKDFNKCKKINPNFIYLLQQTYDTCAIFNNGTKILLNDFAYNFSFQTMVSYVIVDTLKTTLKEDTSTYNHFFSHYELLGVMCRNIRVEETHDSLTNMPKYRTDLILTLPTGDTIYIEINELPHEKQKKEYYDNLKACQIIQDKSKHLLKYILFREAYLDSKEKAIGFTIKKIIPMINEWLHINNKQRYIVDKLITIFGIEWKDLCESIYLQHQDKSTPLISFDHLFLTINRMMKNTSDKEKKKILRTFKKKFKSICENKIKLHNKQNNPRQSSTTVSDTDSDSEFDDFDDVGSSNDPSQNDQLKTIQTVEKYFHETNNEIKLTWHGLNLFLIKIGQYITDEHAIDAIDDFYINMLTGLMTCIEEYRVDYIKLTKQNKIWGYDCDYNSYFES